MRRPTHTLHAFLQTMQKWTQNETSRGTQQQWLVRMMLEGWVIVCRMLNGWRSPPRRKRHQKKVRRKCLNGGRLVHGKMTVNRVDGVVIANTRLPPSSIRLPTSNIRAPRYLSAVIPADLAEFGRKMKHE